MRLCYVSSNYLVGGIEKLLHSLCTSFRDRGLEFQLCLLRDSGPFVEMMRRDFPKETHVRGFAGATRFIRSGAFDVVHAYGLRSELAGCVAGGRSRIISCIPNPDLKNSWIKRVANLCTSEGVERFWADSHYRAEVGADKLGIPREKIRIIYPGINVDKLKQMARNGARASVLKELNLPDDVRLVVSVGNLRYIKGHHLILKAAPPILRSVPNAVFVFAGADFTNGRIPGQAHRQSIGKSVRFPGYREDAVRFLAAADVVLQPSLSEGLPRTVLEAMALSKPVVASKVGGIPEMIDDGVSGCLIEPGNLNQLVTKTLEILQEPDVGKRLGAKAAKVTAIRFTEERMVQQFQDLYTQGNAKMSI